MMNKNILGLTAALAMFCSPMAFSQMDSTNNSNGMQDSSSTMQSTPASDNHVDVQLKTNTGQTINALIHEDDLKGLKQGDTLQYQGSEQSNGAAMPSDSDSDATTMQQ
ncbi:hypothetical protein [Legionella oakridgensis]|nr:hypothetical protein [Legionella oakridgensis]